jgi:thiamine biosynthesis protein ThiI
MHLLALNSGGIDSPVAMHRMMEHGHAVDAVVFDNRPFTDEDDVETAIETVDHLATLHDTEMTVFVVPHGFVQETFLEQAGEETVKYSCLFSRRVMMRVGSAIAREQGCRGLVTGENLSQVASQTLDNLTVIGEAAELPVFRPLLGSNKPDTTTEAREIGTFALSSQGGITCAANPDYPETHAALEELERVEDDFDVEGLVKRSLEEMEERVLEG